jgi:hypothetical protein
MDARALHVDLSRTRRGGGADGSSAPVGYDETVQRDHVAPLLVVEDVIIGRAGFVLLPAVPREGLYLGAGDVVDLVHDETRDEVKVLGLEPDHDPKKVRLRVSSAVPIGAGFEVWRSQGQSNVVLRRPAPEPDAGVVTLSGARSRRR